MIQQPRQQLSEEYFSSCSDLVLIEQSFLFSDIHRQTKIRDIEIQFELIRAITETKKHKMKLRSNSVFQSKKNRYPQQSIFNHSRVVLQDNVEHKNNQEGYVNANLIPFIENNKNKKLIITQGPTNDSISDLKQMIKQQNIQTLVMLCRHVENGKNKCSDYEIDTTSQIISDNGYLKIQNLNFGQQYNHYIVKHVNYSQWPDRRVPKEISHVHQIIQAIKNFQNICIHCSAGLGRSGVIAAILMIIQSDQWKNNKKLSIFKVVRKIRQYRFGAVQNSEQYKFIYQYFEYLNSKNNSQRQEQEE